MFYSKSTGGFYATEIHGSAIPSDAVSLTGGEYGALMQGQADGFVIVGNAAGIPELADRPAAPPPPPKQFTSLEYLDMFTKAEQLAVVAATMAVPEVKLWYDKMLAAGFITSADPRTEGGLDALVGAGLLTEARKVEILAAMA